MNLIRQSSKGDNANTSKGDSVSKWKMAGRMAALNNQR
jgi:hypothetical protein